MSTKTQRERREQARFDRKLSRLLDVSFDITRDDSMRDVLVKRLKDWEKRERQMDYVLAGIFTAIFGLAALVLWRVML